MPDIAFIDLKVGEQTYRIEKRVSRNGAISYKYDFEKNELLAPDLEVMKKLIEQYQRIKGAQSSVDMSFFGIFEQRSR